VFHHKSQKTSQRDVEAPKTLESLGSFKVSASISEAAMSHLRQNFERLVLVRVSAQKVSCTSLMLRITMNRSVDQLINILIG